MGFDDELQDVHQIKRKYLGYKSAVQATGTELPLFNYFKKNTLLLFFFNYIISFFIGLSFIEKFKIFIGLELNYCSLSKE